MIAADYNRQSAGSKDLADCRFGPAVVPFGVSGIRAHVTAIDRADRLAVIERPSEVEVVAARA